MSREICSCGSPDDNSMSSRDSSIGVEPRTQISGRDMNMEIELTTQQVLEIILVGGEPTNQRVMAIQQEQIFASAQTPQARHKTQQTSLI